MKNYVHQIYYSPETHAKLDPGFIALDNTAQRPDWCEYWAIRRFLLEKTLAPNARYGFLSPKFGEKTGLSAAQVERFLADTPDDVDVVTFSPYFSNIAFFTNVFEQAEYWHPGIAATLAGVVELIAPQWNSEALMNSLLMSAAGTVYCNYFVATPRFWQRWLTLCERIFAVAEAGDTELGLQLNSDSRYVLPTPAKVFAIERIVSIILSTEPGEWKVRNYDSSTLLADNALLDGKYRDEMVTLDALKYAAGATGFRGYADQFFNARDALIARYNETLGTQDDPASASCAAAAQDATRQDASAENDAATPPRHVWQEYLDFESTAVREAYHATGRRDLADMFTVTPSLILDVGCATGSNAGMIKARFPGSRAWGIEMNRAAAEIAREKLDRVLVGRFEDFDLREEGIAHGTLDAVLLADVLEHMYNPWDVMVKLHPYVSPAGQIVISIPNTRNLRLIDALTKGHWPYASGGLLDITHIRFFTLKEIMRLCEETGYRVVAVNCAHDGHLEHYWEYLKNTPGPINTNIELDRITFKNVTREELTELCALQFYLLLEKVPAHRNA